MVVRERINQDDDDKDRRMVVRERINQDDDDKDRRMVVRERINQDDDDKDRRMVVRERINQDDDDKDRPGDKGVKATGGAEVVPGLVGVGTERVVTTDQLEGTVWYDERLDLLQLWEVNTGHNSQPEENKMAAGAIEVMSPPAKKYGSVVITLDNVLIPPDKLSPSPSQQDGLDSEIEMDLRILGCELIQTGGILLKLPQIVLVDHSRPVPMVFQHLGWGGLRMSCNNVKADSGSFRWTTKLILDASAP
ncbi:cyclin-L-like [Homarus americanus]|uniref:Cyclin-L-like n=1 Tax=Homarus americanus TaxID=6706 RepID=A0A8J5MPU5_HOMAM|nr:cyclin-L-like [Homarus americanus]